MIVNLLKKIILILFVNLMIYIGFLYISYVDEVFYEGDAYGFKIGNDKETVYKNIYNRLVKFSKTNGDLFLYKKVNGELAEELGALENESLFIQSRFRENGFSKIKEEDRWVIYTDSDFESYFMFVFCENILCEIRRHQQFFEMP